MRHAAELFLKAATVSLQKLYKIRGQAIEPFDLEGSHDLGKIWSYVKSNALAFEERYNKLIKALSRGLNDIAEIDSTGQVFRYPFDRENNKHLVAVSVINIIVIRDQWRPLERQLRNLDRLNDDLLLEYAQGAFTAHLSRYQLGKIAAALPRRESWGTAAFNAAKASIRSTYALSGNEFSKALNIIQECRDLAALFGYVTDIPGLKEESIGRFFDIWSKMHDLGRMLKPVDENFDPGISFFDIDPEELRRQRELDAALKRELIETLDPEAFAALDALFYFHRDYQFSEQFERQLTIERDKLPMYKSDRKAYGSAARHLLEKTGALTDILNSLNFLGQTSLVNFLVRRYNLEVYIEQLLEPSKRARKSLSKIYL